MSEYSYQGSATRLLLFQLGAYLVICGVALLIFLKVLVPLAFPWQTTKYIGLPQDCNMDEIEDLNDGTGVDLI